MDTVTSTSNLVLESPDDESTDIDGQSLLDGALARYAAGYRFDSVVSVADSEAVSIAGVVIGATAQMEVSSGDGTATYVVTPDGAWIRVEDGGWLELDSGGPFDAPLDALAAPMAIEVVSSSGAEVTIRGVYDGSFFTSEETVELAMSFKDGFLVRASYTTPDAAVSTSFEALDGETVDIPDTSG